MERGWQGENAVKEFSSLSEEERVTVVEQGRMWLRRHRDHVKHVLEEGEAAYPPSGSDLFQPELWKSGHWRWFMAEERRLG